MKSRPGWVEPGQAPEFEEYTIVLSGMLRVKTKNGTMDVHANQINMKSKLLGSR
jgi:hypothetical protein